MRKARRSVADRRTNPKESHSTVLSAKENAIVIAVRPHAQERLADGRRALQAINPHLMYAQRPAK